jgi:hypothetical protein
MIFFIFDDNEIEELFINKMKTKKLANFFLLS